LTGITENAQDRAGSISIHKLEPPADFDRLAQNKEVYSLKHIREVVVLDEADRMFWSLALSLIFAFNYYEECLHQLLAVLLFSATLSHRVMELAYEP
jgi:superfamily II DNA/RNA helicase